MRRRRSEWWTGLASSAVLVAGCGAPHVTGPTGSPSSGPPDAAGLIQQALEAREDDDLTGFADLVSTAAASCPDSAASGRLGEVAVIAGRWAAAVLEGRPKQQAVTEAQLAEVDWASLATACGGEASAP